MSRVEQLQELENKVCELFAKKHINYEKVFDEYGLIISLVKIEDAQMDIEGKIDFADFADEGDVIVTDYAGIRDNLLDLHTFAAIALMMLDKKELNVKKIEPDPLPPPLVNPVHSHSGMTTVEKPILVELPPDNEDAALKEVALKNAQKQLSQAEDERRTEQKKQKSSHKYDKDPILFKNKKEKKKRWSHLKPWRA